MDSFFQGNFPVQSDFPVNGLGASPYWANSAANQNFADGFAAAKENTLDKRSITNSRISFLIIRTPPYNASTLRILCRWKKYRCHINSTYFFFGQNRKVSQLLGNVKNC